MADYRAFPIHIDGRGIPYKIITAYDYFKAKDGLVDDHACEKFIDNNFEIYELVTQILGLKQSCFLLRRTTHSCQSLSDHLYYLKNRLIIELKDVYNYSFDDDFVEKYGYEE